MRKMLFIALLLLVPICVNAEVFGVDAPAKVFSITTPDKVFGVAGLADACSPGTYLSYTTFDYPSDTDKMCINSGASQLDGTVTGATIDTWANHGISGPTGGGAYGVKFDATDEYVGYSATGDNVANDQSGTCACEIYAASWASGNHTFFGLAEGNNNNIHAAVNSAGRVYLAHEGNTVIVAMTGADSISTSTWTTIRISWSTASNQTSTKVGANDWDVDADADTVTAFSSAQTDYYIGDAPIGVGVDNAFFIDNFRCSGAYQDEAL